MARSHKSNYFPCRCSRETCKKRITLHYRPDDTVCKACGSPLRVDTLRKQRRDGETCYCPARAGRDGNMPHRKGGHHLCEHFKVPF